MEPLAPHDFDTFFKAMHDYPPFPWQKRLADTIDRTGQWPSLLNLPTGTGKTAAIDIAVFHLALEASRARERRAPARVAFVVDRRLVVDDAYERAKTIAAKLAAAPADSVLGRVAASLRALSGGDTPLIARRLRGGVPREDDWARTPTQPTVLCSTVDQVGSRLLFRGYGVSDRMKPVHAGLLGADCLLLLDEAHLAEPFRQTLEWIERYRSDKWRDPERSHTSPWAVAVLTATPGDQHQDCFELDADDYSNEVLARRLDARKPARLITPVKEKSGDEEQRLVSTIVAEAESALSTLRAAAVECPAIGVVVNRVARARCVFEALRRNATADAHMILMIGPSRPIDRDHLVRDLAPIRTSTWQSGESRSLQRSIIVVATQCLEAGVDIDLDALITEAAPLDALRQRFGRLNRAGRDIAPYGAIIASNAALDKRVDDPVYGSAIHAAWHYMTTHAASIGASRRSAVAIDFGLNAWAQLVQSDAQPTDAISQKANAPILVPAHVDLLAQTSPVPHADPEVSFYLHGLKRQPDSVTVVWRADLSWTHQDNDRVRRLLLLVPPRASEAIELPRWVVRGWLEARVVPDDTLADIPIPEPDGELARESVAGRSVFRRASDDERFVFRWKGDDERSKWIPPAEIRSGDTIVVPATYGGLDQYGWHPALSTDAAAPVHDVADRAADAFSRRRYAVRIAPGLIDEAQATTIADAVANAASRHWRDLRAALDVVSLPESLRRSLADLEHARRNRVRVHEDLYGYDDDQPRGLVFEAPFGIDTPLVSNEEEAEGQHPSSTEDDVAGSLLEVPIQLERHCTDVARVAENFARLAGLRPSRVGDLQLAGLLHDIGKVDQRFQSWLNHSDPLGPDPNDVLHVLAKSGRTLPRHAGESSGLPHGWRHEAFSIRLAPTIAWFSEADDPELVLWLIGTHHGCGRPFFPHDDPDDRKARTLPRVLGLSTRLEPGIGPQSLAYDCNGSDWVELSERMQRRYGVWELARMEAILRLADHRASEAEEREFTEAVPQ